MCFLIDLEDEDQAFFPSSSSDEADDQANASEVS